MYWRKFGNSRARRASASTRTSAPFVTTKTMTSSSFVTIADIEEPEELESTEIDGLVTLEHQNRGALQVFLQDGYES